MPNTTTEPPKGWAQKTGLAALAIIVMLLGGCALVMNKPHTSGPSTNPFDDSAHPLTDDQTMAQVLEPAKQIVAISNLQGVDGGFSFASCNDQGDPPYQGRVTIGFLLQGDPDTYFQHIRDAMRANGWNSGAPPGQHLHGTTLNKNGVTANLGYIPSDHSRGQILLYGECRDPNDHHHDPGAGVDVTNQLNAR